MAKRTSMGRSIEVLLSLAEHSQATASPWRVGQLASTMERDRSQVSRTLAQSLASGLVDSTRLGYRPSVMTYGIAQALTSQRLRTDGLTVLERLAELTGEACFLGELFGDSTVTVAESLADDTDLFASWVGRAYPAVSSDAGQATLWDASADEVEAVLGSTRFDAGGPNAALSLREFLDRLEAARLRGYSVIDEEAEAGLFSVAAPVFDFRGEAIAALQIVGEKPRLAPRVAKLGAACAAAARDLTALVGGHDGATRD
ncbi:IclR family transcriptional regulator [Leucobacter aridicollis]|uniref:IclR family transcriptional regulator n=1 Tax=Leucobacter aridicollis TaxID=283878 RepID=UPI000EAD2986